MIRNIKNITFVFALLMLMIGFLSCNYQAELNFPDTSGEQIIIKSITYGESSGSGDGTIVRANTITFTLVVENAENDTFTITWINNNDSTTLSENGVSAEWTAPYASGEYYVHGYAYDGADTAAAICKITVTNTLPEIVDINYLATTTGNNTINVTVSDKDTFPETTLNVAVVADTGTITELGTTVINSGVADFIWLPAGCAEGITVSLTIDVLDDNPNTVTQTIEFYYQP
ncbi:hypothetical protein KAR04_08915 [Candidatus Calescamantes bacterium]|nr:hypothetical protein [Candidatus Calescamantes bacterium]MCK5599650.1 hypothetical protein [bacterium]